MTLKRVFYPIDLNIGKLTRETDDVKTLRMVFRDVCADRVKLRRFDQLLLFFNRN